MKNGPSRIWKWWLGKCRNDWITTSNPNTTYLGLEPQSPRALRTKKSLHWQMQFPQQLNRLNLTCKLNAHWMHSKSIPNSESYSESCSETYSETSKTWENTGYLAVHWRYIKKRILFLSKINEPQDTVFSHAFDTLFHLVLRISLAVVPVFVLFCLGCVCLGWLFSCFQGISCN